MNRDELSLEAYVVLGNALNLLLHGVATQDLGRLALAVAELQRLDQQLRPVRPREMVQALEHLPTRERTLLLEALHVSERLAGSEAGTLLGAPSDTRSAIAQFLQDHQQTDTVPA